MWRTGAALAFAAILAAAAHGEVSCPTADAEGGLSGVVTFHNVSEPYFFIEDDSGAAWRIECEDAKSCSFAKRGARVAARGVFPKWATTPRLNKARVEVTGQGEVPEHIEMTPAEMHAVDPDGEPARRHWFGRLVSVSGNVIDINRRETYTHVLIGPKSDLVQVVVPCRLDDPLPASLEIGARIRARGVGVYSSARDPHTNLAMPVTDIMVRLDGPGGLKVIQGSPFWTPLRLWLLIGGILLLAGVLVFWVKSREKAKADAVQRERLRLSRDLHDGFQQLLAGTMFRLEAAMNLLPEDATRAREQLEKASDALYHTQAGLRAALWSMTEESEGPNNLSGLVKYAAGRLAHWQGVVHFEFRGEERHVPPSLSGEVLMGLQEAVGNALRHGGATDVKVAFSFRRDELVISIRDNGCGFDVAAACEGSGHLGLRSMRERAGRLGGTMTIKSEVGAGAIVVVRLPYGERQQHDQRTHS